MKNLIFVCCFLISAFTLNAQEKEGAKITIVIDNVLNDQGKVIFALHTKDTFMKGPGILNESSLVKDGKVQVVFNNVPQGTYAILALHDANDNNQMDFSASGMPEESYGVSNNDFSFGPPQFDTAKFEVANKDMTLNIRF